MLTAIERRLRAAILRAAIRDVRDDANGSRSSPDGSVPRGARAGRLRPHRRFGMG